MMFSVPGHDFSSKERTLDVITKEKVSFKDLFLSPKVLSGLQKARFETPSPIQLKAIPCGRCGLDLIVQAKSGTGKTCVFTVISLETIAVDTQCLQVIILAPTREIAVQIEEVITAVGQDIKGLKVGSFIGGRPLNDDKIRARGCHIAVGSPGRIFQLIELDVLKCQSVRLFVLDEADKLLEANFQSQINSIYSMLPANKQMVAASATYPEKLAKFVTLYMREPTFVRLNPTDMALLGIKQYYHLSTSVSNKLYSIFENKIKVVVDLLTIYPFQQALIFSNYHSHAKDLSEACNSSGLPATYISGNMGQERRLEAMRTLKDFKCKVLISTDLTARGIDASNVDLVLNLDVPADWETYMHRTGRSGRFGSRGSVISIVTTGKEIEALAEIAETCSVSIFPITLERGRIEYGNDALRPLTGGGDNVIKNKESSNNIEPVPPAVNNAPRETIVDSESEELETHVQNETIEFPLIPSLPELMSYNHTYVDSNHSSYSYEDLMENLLNFQDTGKFKELKKCDFSPPIIEFFHEADSVKRNQATSRDIKVIQQEKIPTQPNIGNTDAKPVKSVKESVVKPLQNHDQANINDVSKPINSPKLRGEKTKSKYKKEQIKETATNKSQSRSREDLLLPRFSSKTPPLHYPLHIPSYLKEYRTYCNHAWQYYYSHYRLYWHQIYTLYGLHKK